MRIRLHPVLRLFAAMSLTLGVLYPALVWAVEHSTLDERRPSADGSTVGAQPRARPHGRRQPIKRRGDLVHTIASADRPRVAAA